jgi:high-affinity iron transporter
VAATFVVTLREGFEAALLLGIVYTFLDKSGGRQYFGYVTAGGALGFAASVVMGIALTFASGPLLDLGPDLIAAGVMFVAVAVLTWHGWWMGQHARAIRGDVQRKIQEAHATRRLWAIGLIAFTGVFREGAETILFLWGLMAQATVAGGWSPLVGGVLGVSAAAALGWIVFRGGRRLSVRRFFAATSALLLFLAAGLFSAGLGKLEALGVLPQSNTLWDTSFLIGDEGFVGGLLAGLIGYRARPSQIEVAGYVLYLLLVGVWMYRRPVSRARQPVAGNLRGTIGRST